VNIANESAVSFPGCAPESARSRVAPSHEAMEPTGLNCDARRATSCDSGSSPTHSVAVSNSF
jgi:hypothetical protein